MYECMYEDCDFESDVESGEHWTNHNSKHFIELAVKHEVPLIKLILKDLD